MIFFHRVSGIQMAFGINNLVPDPDNTTNKEDETSGESMRTAPLILYQRGLDVLQGE